ncbi:MAG: NUDIX domain-containing protein [Nitrosopumilus sp.]|uniref:bis(5'-nucleosyl)-tetraphosphatase n=1 Tax=Nitrosopumilus sp. TaxID=2024843 RepID=UPI00242DA0EA|nr:NUDIX domain-containing protein [Nitrosopumilus sp.]MCV0366070.1 NUDIX domain-containing protein [Nitrosopumilus sp.]
MIEETSAGIVIFRKEDSKNLFLLLHYPSGHWDFVKGKMEVNETTHQTAIRETKEETGITDIRFVENFEEWIEYNFQYQGELIHKKVVFFLAETKTEKVEISHEHQNYTWMDYNTAMEKTTFDNAKTVLTRAQMLLSKTL